jgi:hypothetical protein
VPAPPRYDPRYPASADVAVRDLGVYAAIAEGAAGLERVTRHAGEEVDHDA